MPLFRLLSQSAASDIVKMRERETRGKKARLENEFSRVKRKFRISEMKGKRMRREKDTKGIERTVMRKNRKAKNQVVE